MDIYLASASPRRRELLEMLRVENLIIRPAQSEEAPPPGAGAGETVIALSKAKAEEIAKTAFGDFVVIGADTIVELDGLILGKPRDAEDAKLMLRALSGRTHRVYTGVTVIRGNQTESFAERTDVKFRVLNDREIDAYIKTGEPLDKAGAYGAQGLGSLFVEALDGDFFNVMGLPLCRLGKMLEKVGVKLI